MAWNGSEQVYPIKQRDNCAANYNNSSIPYVSPSKMTYLAYGRNVPSPAQSFMSVYKMSPSGNDRKPAMGYYFINNADEYKTWFFGGHGASTNDCLPDGFYPGGWTPMLPPFTFIDDGVQRVKNGSIYRCSLWGHTQNLAMRYGFHLKHRKHSLTQYIQHTSIPNFFQLHSATKTGLQTGSFNSYILSEINTKSSKTNSASSQKSANQRGVNIVLKARVPKDVMECMVENICYPDTTVRPGVGDIRFVMIWLVGAGGNASSVNMGNQECEGLDILENKYKNMGSWYNIGVKQRAPHYTDMYMIDRLIMTPIWESTGMHSPTDSDPYYEYTGRCFQLESNAGYGNTLDDMRYLVGCASGDPVTYSYSSSNLLDNILMLVGFGVIFATYSNGTSPVSVCRNRSFTLVNFANQSSFSCMPFPGQWAFFDFIKDHKVSLGSCVNLARADLSTQTAVGGILDGIP